MNIIGIAGTNGSGKDSLGTFLAKYYGWLFVSISDILRSELKVRSQPIERENLRQLSAEWRKQYGRGVLVAKAFQLYHPHQAEYNGLAVSSLRNPGEADEVHNLGGKVAWLDADPKLRYQRIYSRQRSKEDAKIFEQFLQEENDEMQHSGSHHTLSLAGVKAKADIFITNENNDIEQFKQIAKAALNL
jgi:cytidylate kinase